MTHVRQLNQSNQQVRLVLGTAQLGMNYGIANKAGQPDFGLAEKIIEKSWESGIKEYDTAQAYGESEKVLGHALRSLGLESEVKVITKFDPNLNYLDKGALEQSLTESLSRLGVLSLHGLMLHREESLALWDRGLGDILRGFVTEGLTRYIGVSVYSPEKAGLALKTDGIDMIQLPSNIFDRRFEKAGIFDLAQDIGKQIYIRSVFLQGLALMNSEELPEYMQFASQALKKLDALCRDTGLTRQGLALGYARDSYPNAKILFGAETPEQVKNNVNAFSNAYEESLLNKVREAFPNIKKRILNPSLWQQ